MGKIPFSMDVFDKAARDVIASLRAFRGKAKKLVVLDLDDTLWGGIVGDDGWENLKIGGHDPHGEAFAAFQEALKSLTNRGIVLGIVSKNNEEVALEAIRKHPEMVLKMEDFVGWRINWSDKAQNIVDLVTELNLGLQSVVFLDDNPVERARVRDMLPEVFVPELPKDKMQYASFLHNLRCFDPASIGREDQKRTQMYRSEKERETLKKNLPSVEDWLHTLDIEVTAEELNKANLKRTVQLINKTNQMNLTTRRISESELLDWLDSGSRKLWTFRVADKFGDAGLTGIMSIDREGSDARVVDFILSCRVMGRQIEECMVHKAVDYLKGHGVDTLMAEYLPTNKNKPCLEFWQRSQFNTNGSPSTFTWNAQETYPLPDHIKLKNA